MTIYADMFAAQWPQMEALISEAMVYTDASGTEIAVTGTFNQRTESSNLDDTWDVSARQCEIWIAATELTGITITPRQDSILARGISYSVIERRPGNGVVEILLCERPELTGVQHRGRRY